jgi:DNA ligase-1
LLIRSGDTDDWSIWPAASHTIICPVTFIEIGRGVNVTLGIAVSGEVAPLIKLATPEATKVSAFARKAVIDKFGPVRQVGPGLWAELSYEAISPAPRRKIGVALKGAEINHLIWKDGPATPDLSEIT